MTVAQAQARAGIVPQSDWDERESQTLVTVAFNESELATVLAALRMFQSHYDGQDADQIIEDWDHFSLPNEQRTIAPLGTDDISALCERINCGAAPNTITATVRGGTIEEISDVPAGVRVVVRDYDIDGADEGALTKDPAGNDCIESVWE